MFEQSLTINSTNTGLAPQWIAPTLDQFYGHSELKWAWSCRALHFQPSYQLTTDIEAPPCVGDIVIVRVDSIGNHAKIMTAQGERLRLYPGDLLVGTLGNRYATDAYEAEVRTTQSLHILTNAGMIGTVRSRHKGCKRPTKVTFVGYLADPAGRRLNLKELVFRPKQSASPLQNIILMVGSGMNSGKTTTARKLMKALLQQDIRVSACKVTGSVSTNDYAEYNATSAQFVRDFSDYGFPSTYLCPEQELVDLFRTMMVDAADIYPDATIVEIADGLLQRETRLLLESEEVHNQVSGVVLAAPCSSSALYSLDKLQALGYPVLAVSGMITSSPLFMRELSVHSTTPVVPSTGDGKKLAEVVLAHLGIAGAAKCPAS